VVLTHPLHECCGQLLVAAAATCFQARPQLVFHPQSQSALRARRRLIPRVLLAPHRHCMVAGTALCGKLLHQQHSRPRSLRSSQTRGMSGAAQPLWHQQGRSSRLFINPGHGNHGNHPSRGIPPVWVQRLLQRLHKGRCPRLEFHCHGSHPRRGCHLHPHGRVPLPPSARQSPPQR